MFITLNFELNVFCTVGRAAMGLNLGLNIESSGDKVMVMPVPSQETSTILYGAFIRRISGYTMPHHCY